MSNLSYTELQNIKTFEERLKYLQCFGNASEVTFGGHRLLNQMLYKSPQWKETRERVILRDNGCDLGIEDRPINSNILIHHINPITIEQVTNFDPCIFDLNNLICCTKLTHNIIHYGLKDAADRLTLIERRPGDTRLW